MWSLPCIWSRLSVRCFESGCLTDVFKAKTTILLFCALIAYLSIQNRYCDTKLHLTFCRVGEKAPCATVWNRNEYIPSRNTADAGSGSGMIRKFESLSDSLKTAQQQTPPDHRNSSQRIKTTETSQTYTPKGQWPVQPNIVPRNLQDHSLAYKFNHNVQQKKMNENPFDCVPEGKIQVNLYREVIGR